MKHNARRAFARHAKMRAYDRHDLVLHQHDLSDMAKQAGRVCAHRGKKPSPEGRVIERQSSTRSLVEINFKGKTLRVIYSRLHKAIVTVLPNDESAY